MRDGLPPSRARNEDEEEDKDEDEGEKKEAAEERSPLIPPRQARHPLPAPLLAGLS